MKYRINFTLLFAYLIIFSLIPITIWSINLVPTQNKEVKYLQYPYPIPTPKPLTVQTLICPEQFQNSVKTILNLDKINGIYCIYANETNSSIATIPWPMTIFHNAYWHLRYHNSGVTCILIYDEQSHTFNITCGVG